MNHIEKPVSKPFFDFCSRKLHLLQLLRKSVVCTEEPTDKYQKIWEEWVKRQGFNPDKIPQIEEDVDDSDTFWNTGTGGNCFGYRNMPTVYDCEVVTTKNTSITFRLPTVAKSAIEDSEVSYFVSELPVFGIVKNTDGQSLSKPQVIGKAGVIEYIPCPDFSGMDKIRFFVVNKYGKRSLLAEVVITVLEGLETCEKECHVSAKFVWEPTLQSA